METSCDNPFTTGACLFRDERVSKSIRLSEVIQKEWLSGIGMMVRQKVGVILMLLFLPINQPLWRVFMDHLGKPILIGEIYFLGLSLSIFLIGAVLTFSSGLNSDSID